MGVIGWRVFFLASATSMCLSCMAANGESDSKDVVAIKRLVQHVKAQGFTSYYEPLIFFPSTILRNDVETKDVGIDSCRMQLTVVYDKRNVSDGSDSQTVVSYEFDLADLKKVSIGFNKKFYDEALSRESLIPTVFLKFAYDAVSATYSFKKLAPKHRTTYASLSIEMASKEAALKTVELFRPIEMYCKKIGK